MRTLLQKGVLIITTQDYIKKEEMAKPLGFRGINDDKLKLIWTNFQLNVGRVKNC